MISIARILPVVLVVVAGGACVGVDDATLEEANASAGWVCDPPVTDPASARAVVDAAEADGTISGDERMALLCAYVSSSEGHLFAHDSTLEWRLGRAFMAGIETGDGYRALPLAERRALFLRALELEDAGFGADLPPFLVFIGWGSSSSLTERDHDGAIAALAEKTSAANLELIRTAIDGMLVDLGAGAYLSSWEIERGGRQRDGSEDHLDRGIVSLLRFGFVDGQHDRWVGHLLVDDFGDVLEAAAPTLEAPGSTPSTTPWSLRYSTVEPAPAEANVNDSFDGEHAAAQFIERDYLFRHSSFAYSAPTIEDQDALKHAANLVRVWFATVNRIDTDSAAPGAGAWFVSLEVASADGAEERSLQVGTLTFGKNGGLEDSASVPLADAAPVTYVTRDQAWVRSGAGPYAEVTLMIRKFSSELFWRVDDFGVVQDIDFID